MIKSLKSRTKDCQRLIEKANNEALALLSRRPLRSRRSNVENNLPSLSHTRCNFVKKNFKKFPISIWNSLVDRAIEYGGHYLEEQGTIIFNNRNDVIRFFDQNCTEPPSRDATYRNMRKSVLKRERIVNVEILVSTDMPFRIEKSHSGRVQLKYFTGLVQ